MSCHLSPGRRARRPPGYNQPPVPVVECDTVTPQPPFLQPVQLHPTDSLKNSHTWPGISQLGHTEEDLRPSLISQVTFALKPRVPPTNKHIPNPSPQEKPPSHSPASATATDPPLDQQRCIDSTPNPPQGRPARPWRPLPPLSPHTEPPARIHSRLQRAPLPTPAAAAAILKQPPLPTYPRHPHRLSPPIGCLYRRHATGCEACRESWFSER